MDAGSVIEVLTAGLLTSLQDAGRRGYAHLGVGRAGAADAPALRLANALVGNSADACALEITLAGPRLRFVAEAEIALTGAPLSAEIDGQPLPGWSPIRVAAGSVLALGTARVGCRGYLAVGGGIAVEPVLGSRSQDLNAALGPFDGRPLAAGDRLPITAVSGPSGVGLARWSLNSREWFDPVEPCPLRLLPGAHTEWLDSPSQIALWEREFRVGADSNRVGCRLDGPRLRLRAPLEPVSTGVVPGTVQLPPDGRPIVLLCEAPVSGGYPRIGQLAQVDLSRLAQLRAGDRLRFTPMTLDAASQLLAQREQSLLRLEAAIARRRAAS